MSQAAGREAVGTDDGTVEAVDADDDTASTDAERSLGDADKLTADADQRQLSGAPKPEAAHGQNCLEWRPKELPGRYIVTRVAGVMPTMQTLTGDEMPRLTVGQSIEVLEIVNCAEAQRVRARIAEPPGWISLANTDTWTRTAVHADGVAAGVPAFWRDFFLAPNRSHCFPVMP